MRLTLPHVALVGVLAIGLTGGVATAAIPSGDGQIKSCYAANGSLRVIDAEAGGTCSGNEKALAFNQKGPAGPAGPAGPVGPKGATGATGPKGPAGPSFARGHFRTSPHDVGTSWTTLASVDMPAGLHTAAGKASTYEREALGTEWWAMVSCRLLQKSPAGAATVLDTSHTEVSDNYNERATLSVMGFAYVPAGQTDKLHIQCKDDGGPGGLLNELNNIKVIAQQVGGWTALAN